MRLPALVCLLLSVTSNLAAACECLWEGSFSDVQAAADIVVSGRVITGKGNSIDLHIDRQLRGNTPQNPLRIWLKTGDYCRPPSSLFAADTQWVMALHRIDELVPGGFNPGTPNISFGRVGDYRLSSCGGYWLSLKGNRVTGNLVNAPRWVREPPMAPVLLDVLADFISGKIGRSALLEASEADPALRELMLDTRSFLRNESK